MYTETTLETVLKDSRRLESLRTTNLIGSEPELIFDRLTQSVCRKLDVPISAITLIEPSWQHFKSQQGLNENERKWDIKYSMCQYVVHEGSPVAVNDATAIDALRHHPAVTEKGLVSYLGVPLLADGCVIGALCAADIKAREWSREDIRFLENQALMAQLELHVRKVCN